MHKRITHYVGDDCPGGHMETPVSPVVRCRVCGHVAPARGMEERRPVRVFDWQRHRTAEDERWVCRDRNACRDRFR